MYIYIATNKVNGKVYIGQTTHTVDQRMRKHFAEVRSEVKLGKNLTYFHQAIAKYGEDAFEFRELEEVGSIEELNEREVYWIKYYNSTDKSVGYNLDSGGNHCIRSDSTIEKLRKSTVYLHNNRPDYRESSLKGLRNGNKVWQKICQSRMVEFICPVCGETILMTPSDARKRTYCSRECSKIGNAEISSEHMKLATAIMLEKKHERSKEISNTVYSWVEAHPDLVLNCPANKISTTLKDLHDTIYTKYGVKDWRTIGDSIGCRYRKALLQNLKDHLNENICCSSPN